MKKNSSTIRRLFLMAGYSAQNKINSSLVYMIKQFAQYGDVILFMDNDTPDTELAKISKYVIHSGAQRHGEYDFGSYKRAYTYARDTGILQKYDIIYLINDSVYGPLYPIKPYLQKMESFNTDAFGLVYNPHKKHPHIQSWFIGMRRAVFISDWFDKFITSVTQQPNKGAITYLYEQGFTRLLNEHHITWKCLFSASGRSIYNNVKHLYRAKVPFIKRAAFTRHNGRLGGQILYVLNHTNRSARDSILYDARETYGPEYINWLLTKNPIKIISRNIKYFIKKIRTEKL